MRDISKCEYENIASYFKKIITATTSDGDWPKYISALANFTKKCDYNFTTSIKSSMHYLWEESCSRLLEVLTLVYLWKCNGFILMYEALNYPCLLFVREPWRKV